jgi:hypothetical protein
MRLAVLYALAVAALIAYAGKPPLQAAVAGDPGPAGRGLRTASEGQRSEVAGELATIVSTSLGVAFEYPREWVVAEEPSGVRLTVANGGVLVLERLDGEAAVEVDTDLPNTRCGSRTNRNGTTIRTCFDTISRSTSAWFEFEAPGGKSQRYRAWTKGTAGERAIAVVLQSVRRAHETKPR